MASIAIRTALIAALFAAMPAQAAEPGARVQVLFSDPQKFTDLADGYPGTDKGRDVLLGQLEAHLEKQALDHMPPGHSLTVTITDVDMAGGFEPGRNPALSNSRVMRDVYPPRIDLSFSLTGANGKTVKEGERSLTDLAFRSRIGLDRNLLPYERALLDDWLAREFPIARRP